MSLQNNPLKQYFRRPSVYIKLPSGTQYPVTVIKFPENGELPVYPMTAIDDITAKTPDALFNGQAVVDIIKSCVPEIIDPWKLKASDLDAVLIAIRSASSGSTFEISTICPKCAEDSTYGVNLGAVLSGLQAANYDEPLQVSDLQIKFRPLVFKEMNEVSLSQFELQRAFAAIENTQDPQEKNKRSKDALHNITEVTMQTIAKTIEYIKTPSVTVTENEFILDFLRNCDKNVFDGIREHNTKLREQGEIKPLKIKCTACSHEYEQPFTLNVSDFFG